MPGMRPAALPGDAVGAWVTWAGVRRAELAMELPSFSRSQLPGDSFQNAEADQKCRGERQQNGPGIKRNAAKRAGHMRILLWRLAEWNEGIEFQRRKKTSNNNRRRARS